ncbi:bifunctional DNA primase/polymerase [Streptosporangium sp. DT93]|uniref:bifunctional DNA primase/polymerase n=1 Tax=Streptosporangium sp. DT93 TaxID=3393428 RepID=UPI003CF21C5F
MSTPTRHRARRILLTGSRTWTNTPTIRAALAEHWGDGNAVLITGACPRGADAIAETIWRQQSGHVERHPANWETHGKRAGILRNADMVALGADVCLAFIRDASPGATHAAALAERAGIPVRRYTHPQQDNPPPGADRLRYALAAAARGWHVFPVSIGDKPPLKGFTDWETNATTDPDIIRRCWSRAPYNIGIACGPSNLVVIDLDTRKDGQSPPSSWDLPGVNEGADVLAVICERAGEPLPFETFTVRTRRGGTHLYFTAPAGARLGNTEGDKGNGLGWLIDTRAHGGYVLGPGSFVDLPDGTGTYEVIHNAPPAPLPPSLFKQLATPPRATAKPVRLALPDDRRGAFLRAAITGELDRVAAALEGQRNRTLYMAATALGQLVAGGALNEVEVTTLLEQGGVDAGLSATETRLTVASGLKNGARRPRTLAA